MSSAVVSLIAQPLYNANVRKTSNLHVEESCIGCGLCAKKCPVQAIEMQNKKPVWVKDKCVMCLGCLHRCPKFAIQYGNGKTKEHGQYTNPNVKV
jgi:Fe-S-cluster-containing hydrogenase component 2